MNRKIRRNAAVGKPAALERTRSARRFVVDRPQWHGADQERIAQAQARGDHDRKPVRIRHLQKPGWKSIWIGSFDGVVLAGMISHPLHDPLGKVRAQFIGPEEYARGFIFEGKQVRTTMRDIGRHHLQIDAASTFLAGQRGRRPGRVAQIAERQGIVIRIAPRGAIDQRVKPRRELLVSGTCVRSMNSLAQPEAIGHDLTRHALIDACQQPEKATYEREKSDGHQEAPAHPVGALRQCGVNRPP